MWEGIRAEMEVSNEEGGVAMLIKILMVEVMSLPQNFPFWKTPMVPS